MAFSTLQWIQSGFDKGYLQENISSIEDAKNVANQIIEDRAIVALGNSEAPVNWAKEIIYQLSGTDATSLSDVVDKQGDNDVTASDVVFGWLSGSNQSSKKSRYLSKFETAKQEMEDKIANFQSNIANLQDYPEDISAEEKAKIDEQVAQILKDNEDILSTADILGIDVPEATYVEGKGYVPSSEVSASGATTGLSVGRTGEKLGITTNDDGTFSIIGLSSGDTYGDPFSDISSTLAQQTYLQSGSMPQETQTTSTTADTSTTTSTSRSSLLDTAGINYEGLTDDEIKAVESAYLASQNDPTLLEKLINDLEITDEDISGFLETAKTEYAGYYGQQFSRGAEDFQKSLEYAATQREAQLAQEALEKQLALESEQSAMAEAGLATSGIRKKAEEQLAKQAEDVATSSRRSFEYDVFSAGRSAEDVLGSSTLESLQLPELSGVSIYTPSGDIKGSLEAEQTTAEQTRATELEELARLRREEILAGEGGVSVL